jgi:hypothetical protein
VTQAHFLLGRFRCDKCICACVKTATVVCRLHAGREAGRRGRDNLENGPPQRENWRDKNSAGSFFGNPVELVCSACLAVFVCVSYVQ